MEAKAVHGVYCFSFPHAVKSKENVCKLKNENAMTLYKIREAFEKRGNRMENRMEIVVEKYDCRKKEKIENIRQN